MYKLLPGKITCQSYTVTLPVDRFIHLPLLLGNNSLTVQGCW